MNSVKIKLNILIMGLFMAVITVFNHPVYSQQDEQSPAGQEVREDYSTEELKVFIDANREATKVQQEAEQKMVSAIEDEGLDVNTFNQMLTTSQQGSQQDSLSEDDLEKFNNAAEKVMEIQQETMTEVEEAIQDT